MLLLLVLELALVRPLISFAFDFKWSRMPGEIYRSIVPYNFSGLFGAHALNQTLLPSYQRTAHVRLLPADAISLTRAARLPDSAAGEASARA